MGTTEEYLHHMCYNETLMSACDCTTETMVTYKEREDGQGEGGKKSKKKESHDYGASSLGSEGKSKTKKMKQSNYVIMHSVVEDK